MSRVVAIGEEALVTGYALAGVEVVPAADPAAVKAAWDALAPDVGLLVLTPSAKAALADVLELPEELVWAVLPS